MFRYVLMIYFGIVVAKCRRTAISIERKFLIVDKAEPGLLQRKDAVQWIASLTG